MPILFVSIRTAEWMVVMPLKQKSLRVVMAQTEKYTYPALAEAIAAEPGIELIEIKDTLDNIWRKVITHSPDITIFYAPVFENAEKRCVNHILHGVYSSVLVLAEDTYFSHIPRASKLEVFGLVKNKTDKAFIKRIINRVKEIGPVVKDKTGGTRPCGEAEGGFDARLQNHIIAIGRQQAERKPWQSCLKCFLRTCPALWWSAYASGIHRCMPSDRELRLV